MGYGISYLSLPVQTMRHLNCLPVSGIRSYHLSDLSGYDMHRSAPSAII